MYSPTPGYTKGKYRFDSPTARYGVLYSAASLEGAILEVFGDRWLERRAMSEQLLRSYNLVKLTIEPGLWLVNTLGSKLLFAGIDARLFASTDYETAQARLWSTLKILTVSFIIRAKTRAS